MGMEKIIKEVGNLGREVKDYNSGNWN